MGFGWQGGRSGPRPERRRRAVEEGLHPAQTRRATWGEVAGNERSREQPG